MTLVDTSVWIDHLRRPDRELVRRLEDGEVMCHPFVIGDLALGQLSRRDEVLELLHALPALPIVAHALVLAFVTRHRLARTGVGWVDAHLLAAADAAGAGLLTHDARLRVEAGRLRLAAS